MRSLLINLFVTPLLFGNAALPIVAMLDQRPAPSHRRTHEAVDAAASLIGVIAIATNAALAHKALRRPHAKF